LATTIRIIPALSPDSGSDQNGRLIARFAWFEPELTLPCPPRFIQFRLRAFPLWEHPDTFICGQMLGNPEQSIERGDGAGGDNVEFASDSLDLRGVDGDPIGEAQRLRGTPQEVGAQLARLDQAHRPFSQKSNH
jgi:hypothetical protein